MSNDIRTLVIAEGSEFKIKVEKLKDFNESFFKDIYESATVNIKEILDNTKEYYEKKRKKEFFKDKEESNNIIAFAGERGTGKSSVMISFAEALKATELDKCNFEKFRDLKEVSFVNLDIIDPALLEDKESIFEIVIAKMFSKFKEHLEKEDGKLEFDDKKRLLKKFQKVYKDLKVINTDRKDFFKDAAYSEDILQTLVNLASGSNMRKSFIELVNEYLQFFSKDKDNDNNKEKRFLVIPIDDLDMNIKHSAEMAEQIRKYLMVPNVIILMAVKIEQLKDSIEQMYRKNYEVMLKAESLSDDPKEMAERYIEKLIPNGRKLYLPDIRSHKDGREENIKLEFRSNTNDDNKNKEKMNINKLSIENTVLKMTYEKTGLIFIRPEHSIHYLVPDNLRELQNYLVMLNKFENIKESKELEHNEDGECQQEEKVKNEIVKMKNVEKFEGYFLKTWIKRNLKFKYIKMIEEFYNKSIAEKNKFIVNAITDEVYIKSMREQYELKDPNREGYINRLSVKDKELIENIIERANNPLNISIGDVLAVINVYDKYLNNEEYRKLTFALKTIYSIIINKIKKSIYEIQTLNLNIEKKQNNELEKYFDEVSTLIGSNVFIPTVGTISIPSLWKERNFDDYRKFKLSDSEDLMKEFFDGFINQIDAKIVINDKNKKLFHKFEWMHYFLNFYNETDTEKTFRTGNFPYHELDTQIGNPGGVGRKKAKISIMPFVSYIINPEAVIDRIFNYYKIFENEKDIKENEKFKAIVDISLSKQILEWREKFFCVLPIDSIEVLERILKNTYYIFSKKRTGSNLISVFKTVIKTLNQSINNTYDELNGIFKLRECDNMKMSYEKCPIITPFLDSKKDPNSLTISDIESILNSIEMITEEQETNEKIIQDIDKKLYILDDRISYFSKTKVENYVPATIAYNARLTFNEVKTSKISEKQIFEERFQHQIETWVGGIEENQVYSITDGEIGKSNISKSYIEKLLEILKNKKNELENKKTELENKKEKVVITGSDY